jgi:hypothetical protein
LNIHLRQGYGGQVEKLDVERWMLDVSHLKQLLLRLFPVPRVVGLPITSKELPYFLIA